MKWIFIIILIGFCIHIILDIVSDLLVMFSEKIRKQIIKKLIEEQGLHYTYADVEEVDISESEVILY